jgi:hypothetical protein
MRKRPHVTMYNAQQLRKALNNMTAEQRESRVWWTHLGPGWDHWTLDQLEQLIKFFNGGTDETR